MESAHMAWWEWDIQSDRLDVREGDCILGYNCNIIDHTSESGLTAATQTKSIGYESPSTIASKAERTNGSASIATPAQTPAQSSGNGSTKSATSPAAQQAAVR